MYVAGADNGQRTNSCFFLATSLLRMTFCTVPHTQPLRSCAASTAPVDTSPRHRPSERNCWCARRPQALCCCLRQRRLTLPAARVSGLCTSPALHAALHCPARSHIGSGSPPLRPSHPMSTAEALIASSSDSSAVQPVESVDAPQRDRALSKYDTARSPHCTPLRSSALLCSALLSTALHTTRHDTRSYATAVLSVPLPCLSGPTSLRSLRSRSRR